MKKRLFFISVLVSLSAYAGNATKNPGACPQLNKLLFYCEDSTRAVGLRLRQVALEGCLAYVEYGITSKHTKRKQLWADSRTYSLSEISVFEDYHRRNKFEPQSNRITAELADGPRWVAIEWLADFDEKTPGTASVDLGIPSTGAIKCRSLTIKQNLTYLKQLTQEVK